MYAVGIDSEINSIYNILYDLSEGKCNYGKIIASESQYRDTDKESEYCRKCSTDKYRDKELCSARYGITDHTCKYCRAERSYTHKARMTEAELSGYSDNQIK